jgi:hypothetical protein
MKQARKRAGELCLPVAVLSRKPSELCLPQDSCCNIAITLIEPLDAVPDWPKTNWPTVHGVLERGYAT